MNTNVVLNKVKNSNFANFKQYEQVFTFQSGNLWI